MTTLWQVRNARTVASCSITRGCAGVDLEVIEGTIVTRRERHPDRSTAYERAVALRLEYERAGYRASPH